jgi:aryl-alcohol dehydrogenase-like predicted oxidoreductase
VTLFDTAQAYGFGASERLLADLQLDSGMRATIDEVMRSAQHATGPSPDSN